MRWGFQSPIWKHPSWPIMMKMNIVCVISLAYYSAQNTISVSVNSLRGKGMDIVFLPRQNHLDKPGIISELKWNHSSEGAITQIKERRYAKSGKTKGKLLLVGINYSTKTKEHECYRGALKRTIVSVFRSARRKIRICQSLSVPESMHNGR